MWPTSQGISDRLLKTIPDLAVRTSVEVHLNGGRQQVEVVYEVIFDRLTLGYRTIAV